MPAQMIGEVECVRVLAAPHVALAYVELPCFPSETMRRTAARALHTGAMPAELVDEVEFVRLLGAPFAGGSELREAVEMIVNGECLSELLGGLPLDVAEMRSQANAWVWGGHDVALPTD